MRVQEKLLLDQSSNLLRIDRFMLNPRAGERHVSDDTRQAPAGQEACRANEGPRPGRTANTATNLGGNVVDQPKAVLVELRQQHVANTTILSHLSAFSARTLEPEP
jgi:hypothetical protein